ncbi:hypothetical protein [Paraburkholderia caribensis]|uniref:hypothetical protein n=1 Tax=Paraburkholderia caribensis TaxID=75105 RepID=UPI0011B1DACA|nr:hypothetical protein [Paraburkholderia caribensis]
MTTTSVSTNFDAKFTTWRKDSTNGGMSVTERYSQETLRRTAMLIQERFHMSTAGATQLAAKALKGIDAHGLDPDDWDTVVTTVA